MTDRERSQYSAVSKAEHMASLRRMTFPMTGDEPPVVSEPDSELTGCDLALEAVRELVAAALARTGAGWTIEGIAASSFVPGVSHVRLRIAGLGIAELGYESSEELAAHLETLRARLLSTAWSCPSCDERIDVLGLVLERREGWRCACGTVCYASHYVGRGSAPATAHCWYTVALLAALDGGAGMPARSVVLTCVSAGPVPVEDLFSGVSFRPAGSSRDGALATVFAIAPDARVRDFTDVHPRAQASLAAADEELTGCARVTCLRELDESTEKGVEWLRREPESGDQAGPKDCHLVGELVVAALLLLLELHPDKDDREVGGDLVRDGALVTE